MIKTNIMSRIAVIYTFSCFFLFSCDKDVSDVGGNVLTSTNIDTKALDEVSIETENISLRNIQSNNLSGGYLLGTSLNPKTGNVKYGILLRAEPTTSVNLDTIKTSFSSNANSFVRIKSANLIIPYSYEKTTTEPDENGEETYRIVGPYETGVETFNIVSPPEEDLALKLDVFRSDYNLELASNSSNNNQIYYANAAGSLNPFGESIQTNSILNEIIDANSNSESFNINVVDEDGVSLDNSVISDSFETLEKTLRISLNTDFLGTSLVDSEGKINDLEVLDTDEFLNAFKGIYIKVSDDNEKLARVIDFSVSQISPKIEVVLEVVNETIPDGEDGILDSKIIEFELDRQIINILEFEDDDAYINAEASSELMTVKSGVSASRIKLFSDNSQLTSLFDEGPIISQAVLRLYVNEDSPLYVEENTPLNLWINRLESGGLLSGGKLSSDDGLYYDFLVTQYLKDLLNVDSKEELPEANLDLVVGVSGEAVNGEFGSLDAEVIRTQSLLIFNENRQQTINIGSLQFTGEVPLYGSGADEDVRPRLSVKYTATK